MKITMHCSDDFLPKEVTIVQEYPDDTTWYKILPQFNEFLAGMGYIATKYNTFVVEYAEAEQQQGSSSSVSSF